MGKKETMEIHKAKRIAKAVFVTKDNSVKYYNITLNNHIIANYVPERHISLMVDGFNDQVKQKVKAAKQTRIDNKTKQFGFTIVQGKAEVAV